MPNRVDQILAGYVFGDAISREARVFRDVFREMGYASDIFAPEPHIAPTVKGDALPLSSFKDDPDNLVLYHFSIGSEASECYLGSRATKYLKYHNITPAHFFTGYDARMVEILTEGRREFLKVAEASDLVLADSLYNAEEAQRAGAKRVEVMELVADLEEVEPDESKICRYDDGLGNILFVGRMVPNKGVEELIAAFRWINKAIDEKSRLILVGSERSCPSYYAMLKMLATDLELDNICFEGYLNEAELAACYSCADVFVCASRHEGYCLPLIEAMKYGVPVVARRAGGMPQAISGAGVMFDELEPKIFGELIAKCMWDEALRKRILASQERRLEMIASRDLKREWSRML